MTPFALPRDARGGTLGIEPRWLLVDHAPRILGQVPDSLSGFAARTLERRGIEILTRTAVARIDPGAVTLSDGRRVETETVVWTAGIATNPLAAQLGLPIDHRGRIKVDETLQVESLPHV
jgi:NADH dehydrogenase